MYFFAKHLIILCILFFIFNDIVSSNDCQSLDQKLVSIKEKISASEKVELNSELRKAFVVNYNKLVNSNQLDVDRLVLLMTFDKNIWFVFGEKNNCFSFWIDLEPDRFIELVDNGNFSKEQGPYRSKELD